MPNLRKKKLIENSENGYFNVKVQRKVKIYKQNKDQTG